MPAKLGVTLGAKHVLTTTLLLDVDLALGALLGEDHHELHLDLLLKGLVLPALYKKAGHCVMLLFAASEAKSFPT